MTSSKPNAIYETARLQAIAARHEMKSSFSKLTADVAETPRVVQIQVKDNLKDIVHELSPAERIRRNPKSAVAAAFVAGAVVGLMIPGAKAVQGSRELNSAYQRARNLFSQASGKITGLAERNGIPQSTVSESRKMVLSLAVQLMGGIVSKLVAEHAERKRRNFAHANTRGSNTSSGDYYYHG